MRTKNKIYIRIDSSGNAEIVHLPYPRRGAEIQRITTEYISAISGKQEIVLINPAFYACSMLLS